MAKFKKRNSIRAFASEVSMCQNTTKTKLWKVNWSTWHQRGTKKKYESPTGVKPMISRTPSGCSDHWWAPVMSRTMAVLVHYKSLYISLPSSANKNMKWPNSAYFGDREGRWLIFRISISNWTLTLHIILAWVSFESNRHTEQIYTAAKLQGKIYTNCFFWHRHCLRSLLWVW